MALSLALLLIHLPCGLSAAGQRIKGATVITSERLFADNKANFALFEGSVIAKNEEITLYSESMKVYYTEEGDVSRIIAESDVKLVSESGVVTSGHAVYDAAERRITFTGEPKAVDGSNVITGSRMIYLVDEDRSIVEDSKVFLEEEK
jgi:lipopolysaccharide export system protein LptA